MYQYINISKNLRITKNLHKIYMFMRVVLCFENKWSPIIQIQMQGFMLTIVFTSLNPVVETMTIKTLETKQNLNFLGRIQRSLFREAHILSTPFTKMEGWEKECNAISVMLCQTKTHISNYYIILKPCFSQVWIRILAVSDLLTF